MKLKEWGAFVLLGLIWGSSFLWIKIAVEDVGPLVLASIRVLFGLIGLLVVLRLTGNSFPRERRIIGLYFILSIFQTALPFALISWSETRIASSLASILNGTVPLFTILVAHFWLHDEKITISRIAGLIIGFLGVVTLVSRDFGPEGLSGNLLGQLAMLGASVSYSIGITFTRKFLRGQQPVVQSTMTLLFADMLLWLNAFSFEQPIILPHRAITWFALLWLGLLGTCIAYLLYFFLINSWGATRASVVTYVFPVVGLILGLIFLKETVDWRLGVGSLLVVAGIVVINLKRQATQASSQVSAPIPATAQAELD